jgi:serpin B
MRLAVALTLLAMTAAAAPPADRDALVRGNTAFALDLYRRQPAGNIFFSPYSISTAMAMVDAGARGATAKEIESAMHLPFGSARLAQGWTALLDDVNRHGGGYELVTANAMWPARDIELRADYVAMAKKDFGAAIEQLDFARAAEGARARINAWASEATRQRIQNLLTPGSINGDIRLVLTNAVYMKATWTAQFQKDRTNESGVFHAPGGDMKVPLMYQVSYFRYGHVDGVKVIELPYEGGELSMLIVLPDAPQGLAAEEATLTPQSLARWEEKLEMRRVSLGLPRFSSEIGLELAPVLRAMGIRLAFDTHGAADFSGIAAKENICISAVVHKARVDVTEKGTEAAAATSVLMRAGSSGRQEPPPEIFHADHPFFFVIRRTASKSILFIGRLAKP